MISHGLLYFICVFRKTLYGNIIWNIIRNALQAVHMFLAFCINCFALSVTSLMTITNK